MNHIGITLFLAAYLLLTCKTSNAEVSEFTNADYNFNDQKELIFKKHKISKSTRDLLRGKIKQHLPFKLNMFERCNIKQESYLLIKYRKNQKYLTLNYNVRF